MAQPFPFKGVADGVPMHSVGARLGVVMIEQYDRVIETDGPVQIDAD